MVCRMLALPFPRAALLDSSLSSLIRSVVVWAYSVDDGVDSRGVWKEWSCVYHNKTQLVLQLMECTNRLVLLASPFISYLTSHIKLYRATHIKL